MTLKEQTIKRIENQKEKMEKDNQTFGRTSVFDRLELEYLESVLKDLEVLEILKKNTKLVDYGEREIFGGELYILQGFRITNREDYQKIKEWIENDR